jgi:signal transduction histidine kinase
MGMYPGRFGGFKLSPRACDILLAGTLLAINLMTPGDHDGTQIDLTLTGASLSVFATIALLARRRAPLTVLALTAAAATGYAITEGVKSPIGLFVAAAIYTVVLQKDRRTQWIAVTASAVLTIAISTAFTNGDLLANLFAPIVVLFAAALAGAVSYRRAYLAELERRVLRAEHSREEEAERRVIEERLRIAHELHDVIAHHIALMNVQAGVASHLLRDQPEEAERALALVRNGGRTVLHELTVLLGVLRRSGNPLPTAPTPSLQEVGSLIESFSVAGLSVEWQPPVVGELPEVIELTAYRILQESLTNVVKHAPGATVHVRLEQRPGALVLVITDDGGHPGTPYRNVTGGPVGAGHGLLGMRERVAAVGGDLSTGPLDGGGFRVHAVLPLETGAVRDDPGTAGRRSDADPQRVPCVGELGARAGSRR